MSGVASPRQPREDAKRMRRRILEVGLREFVADPNVSLDGIAHAAGVARRTIYGHFSSREALFEEIVDNAVTEVTAAVEAVDIMTGDPAERLTELVLAAWSVADRFRLVTELQNRGVATEHLFPRLGDARNRKAALVREGQRLGRFRTDVPAAALAWMLESLMLGIVQAVDDGSLDASEAGRAVATTTLGAVGLSPAESLQVVERVHGI